MCLLLIMYVDGNDKRAPLDYMTRFMTRFYDQSTKRGSQLATEILDFDWLIENVFCALETTVRFFVVKLTTPSLQPLQRYLVPGTTHQ